MFIQHQLPNAPAAAGQFAVNICEMGFWYKDTGYEEKINYADLMNPDLIKEAHEYKQQHEAQSHQRKRVRFADQVSSSAPTLINQSPMSNRNTNNNNGNVNVNANVSINGNSNNNINNRNDTLNVNDDDLIDLDEIRRDINANNINTNDNHINLRNDNSNKNGTASNSNSNRYDNNSNVNVTNFTKNGTLTRPSRRSLSRLSHQIPPQLPMRIHVPSEPAFDTNSFGDGQPSFSSDYLMDNQMTSLMTPLNDNYNGRLMNSDNGGSENDDTNDNNENSNNARNSMSNNSGSVNDSNVNIATDSTGSGSKKGVLQLPCKPAAEPAATAVQDQNDDEEAEEEDDDIDMVHQSKNNSQLPIANELNVPQQKQQEQVEKQNVNNNSPQVQQQDQQAEKTPSQVEEQDQHQLQEQDQKAAEQPPQIDNDNCNSPSNCNTNVNNNTNEENNVNDKDASVESLINNESNDSISNDKTVNSQNINDNNIPDNDKNSNKNDESMDTTNANVKNNNGNVINRQFCHQDKDKVDKQMSVESNKSSSVAEFSVNMPNLETSIEARQADSITVSPSSDDPHRSKTPTTITHSDTLVSDKESSIPTGSQKRRQIVKTTNSGRKVTVNRSFRTQVEATRGLTNPRPFIGRGPPAGMSIRQDSHQRSSSRFNKTPRRSTRTSRQIVTNGEPVPTQTRSSTSPRASRSLNPEVENFIAHEFSPSVNIEPSNNTNNSSSTKPKKRLTSKLNSNNELNESSNSNKDERHSNKSTHSKTSDKNDRQGDKNRSRSKSKHSHSTDSKKSHKKSSKKDKKHKRREDKDSKDKGTKKGNKKSRDKNTDKRDRKSRSKSKHTDSAKEKDNDRNDKNKSPRSKSRSRKDKTTDKNDTNGKNDNNTNKNKTKDESKQEEPKYIGKYLRDRKVYDMSNETVHIEQVLLNKPVTEHQDPVCSYNWQYDMDINNHPYLDDTYSRRSITKNGIFTNIGPGATVYYRGSLINKRQSFVVYHQGENVTKAGECGWQMRKTDKDDVGFKAQNKNFSLSPKPGTLSVYLTCVLHDTKRYAIIF